MAPARVSVPEPDLTRLVVPAMTPEKVEEAAPARVSAELAEAVMVPVPAPKPPRMMDWPPRLTVAPAATSRALETSPRASALATVRVPPLMVTLPV